MDNFSEMDGLDGNLVNQGVWKTKQKLFPKIKPTLPEKLEGKTHGRRQAPLLLQGLGPHSTPGAS